MVLAAVLVIGIPWIREALNTVSTDDAYVNGHVTFVAAAAFQRAQQVLRAAQVRRAPPVRRGQQVQRDHKDRSVLKVRRA